MSNCYVDPTAIIEKDVTLGKGTKVWHFVHIMENAKIGENCVIADFVYIGKDVIIGKGVKIENRATVYDGVTIDDNVFVGPHVTFTNDLYPRSFKQDWKKIQTSVKEGASIGAGTIIVCGITIGQYALIGAGSTITRDIPPNSLAFGNPARVRGFVCKCNKKLVLKKKCKKYVYMVCSICNEKYQIPIQDYSKLKINSW